MAQVDLVGPRHLDGGVRFHALNQIDVCSHRAGIEIVTDRGDERVIAGLCALWGRHGVPDRVQFDKRFFRQERFTGREQLAERARAFERFHNAQHRCRATAGRVPDQAAPPRRQAPLALEDIPAGWPAAGRVEFIRFIRSDHKLRLLGRAIRMPDGHAYQYLTATLDLATAASQDNLLISDEHGELITTARLPVPGGHR